MHITNCRAHPFDGDINLCDDKNTEASSLTIRIEIALHPLRAEEGPNSTNGSSGDQMFLTTALHLHFYLCGAVNVICILPFHCKGTHSTRLDTGMSRVRARVSSLVFEIGE